MSRVRGSLVGSTALVAAFLIVGTQAARADQVIADDLIVQGSTCVGLDCLNGESFGFATLKLKENNTRILFEDTSTGGGFPATSWQLTANDSASGGRSLFAIDNVTRNTRPFTVLDGAGNNALVVGSNSKIGIGTDSPLLDLHIQSGNTPAIRLDQTNAGGFTAQTWDIGANEANFFIRDLTGGSRLPFRIRPGAPTSSIDIAASGNVGLGTANPLSKLHVSGLGDADTFGTFGPGQAGTGGTGAVGNPGLTVGYAGATRGDGGSLINAYSSSGTAGNLAIATDGTTRMVIDAAGNVGIGTTNPGAQLATTGTVRFAGLSNCSNGLATNANGDLQCGVNGGSPFVSENTAGALAPVASGANATAGGYGARATTANSTAVGNGATATGVGGGSTAFGRGATASESSATAIGTGAQALGDGSTATGFASLATAAESTATGAASEASGNASTATGTGSVARATYATATGYAAGSYGLGGTATGGFSNASGAYSTATGYGSYAAGDGSAAYGNGAAAGGLRSNTFTNAGTTAIGDGALAGAGIDGATNATALGAGAQANAAGSVALGQGSIANAANTVSVGDVGAERRIVNVAAGTLSATSTDAVNGSQLFAAIGGVNASIANIPVASSNQAAAGTPTATGQNATAIGYGAQANADRSVALGNGSVANEANTVSVGAVGAERRIVNVAAGTLSAGSTEAVNGGQLFATNSQVTANTGDIAALRSGSTGVFRADNSGGAAAPQASGANAVAGGYGSVASGGSTTAVGTGARATQFGATAYGAGAVASGDPTTAMGFNAMATGDEASAFGAFATASATNSTAIGRSATASGENAVALGFSATAAQANSVAIGANVSTTRANQIAIGSATQTYTLAGVTSAQSTAAQTGPTRYLTTDQNGNIAAVSAAPSDVAALDGRVASLEAGYAGLSRYAVASRTEARRGIAAVAATAPMLMPSAPGRTTLTVKASGYRGEYGTGFTVAHRLDTALPAVVFGSYSSGSGREHIVSGGAGVEF